MKKLTIGLLAHVDAGKTTLAEAMLFQSGNLRKAGRVDHGDTVMDTHPLERERGISIFTGQAILKCGDCEIHLLDTPGHADFSAEMERTLQVLDAAVLVINGTAGIQAHTLTLWRLLRAYQIPTFIFVTKMDFCRLSREILMHDIQEEFGANCIDFSEDVFSERCEQIALTDAKLLDIFLETDNIPDEEIAKLISQEEIFPCFFGSGLKMTGIDDFLAALKKYIMMPVYSSDFGARVYKISRDEKGTRLTHLKITGGILKVKSVIDYGEKQEKIDQIRLINGKKFQTADQAKAGDICAVTGISGSFAGQGLGFEAEVISPVLEPVMDYRVVLPEGADPEDVIHKLKCFEEEDPLLKLQWQAGSHEIRIKLMGEIQTEIIRELAESRFGLTLDFDAGKVLYKETICSAVEGAGHYEPLRHYAEVRLLLTPLPLGSGIVIDTDCNKDDLDRNWQRLILTHLMEKQHLGVLTGSPITDIQITLKSGKAHLKHTEGGDFRQATYRAVRQGLMQAESALLEPYYVFRLIVPVELTGKAMTDIKARCGALDAPELNGEMMILSGKAPASLMQNYASELTAYTGGRGRLFLLPSGYGPCHNTEEVIASFQYDPERDLDNSPDSVFCSQGSGYLVKWSQVPEMMHTPSCLKKIGRVKEERNTKIYVSDSEMAAIMDKIYGPQKQVQQLYPAAKHSEDYDVILKKGDAIKHFIIDGYNVVFGWTSLNEKASQDLSAARDDLLGKLTAFAAFEKCRITLVFDGYKVAGNIGESIFDAGVEVVFTKEQETADAYIEKMIYEIGKNENVYIVSSDSLIQQSATAKGVLRMSIREFEKLVTHSYEKTRKIMEDLNRPIPGRSIQERTGKKIIP